MAVDPIDQFQITKLFTIGHIGGQEIAFTNSSAYMFASVAVISLLMIGGSARRQLVPGRFQSLAELSYEFVASMIRSRIGPEGMKFFPLVFSLFMFICVSNLIGLIPYAFTVSSHIIVTGALALLVFFIVLFYGLYKNGLKFFKLFVPSGVPIGILPLVVLIEILAFFFVKPVSHSLRLFQYAGGPHRAEGVRELCRYARYSRLDWLACCDLPTWLDRRANRARTVDRVPAGLCLRHPRLHLPQRCCPSGPLTADLFSS